ncbi:hypothetical protein [Parasitella parasitica]|uniref:MHYT domain-containing protein n=1 Tax=Parasitella parasitica TaxID=35722 RepID=A0A0B7MYW0_9FUNG|nr:hypothetical protein [Parasitella parasitica]
MGAEAVQSFNGGIIFVSYLISVAGAQTTLELLTRRTHIRGYYNWFLLAAAAFVMGAVSIWSMHFIGNNSMTLIVQAESYQLSYKAGYTFASLVVAIACMFLAFAFVGVTEEAKVSRIIPSGIFAGLGIVCMHYMGQFAIDYFVLVYKIGYLIGAIVIACVAVTVALYIFFKLREKWMNLWYKRLGCACLMALAVCGMHYTALVGTEFYRPNSHGPIPVPKLQTPALIGIISAVIVSACVGLIYISVKAGMKKLPMYTKNTNKRLILDSVIFDPMGRILVKVDGTLPMTEVVHNLELNESKQEFSTSHPLFVRLFETAVHMASLGFTGENRPSGLSGTSSMEAFDVIETQFLDGCQELRRELDFHDYGDIGILGDIVVTTDTISKATHKFAKSSQLFRSSSGSSWSKKVVIQHSDDAEISTPQQNLHYEVDPDGCQRQSTGSGAGKAKLARIAYNRLTHHKKKATVDDEETVIETVNTSSSKRSSGGTTLVISNNNGHHRSSSEETTHQDEVKSVADRLSVEDSDGEDKHIFMVRKLVDEKDVDRLLSQGYRFAEPIFIAKTMGSKLRIPTEHMRHHFEDLLQMCDSVCALTQHGWVPSDDEPAPKPTAFKASTNSSVLVGTFVLVDETKELTNMHILVDKAKRFAFPLVQLSTDKNDVDYPRHLEADQLEFLHALQGHSLFDMANLTQLLLGHKEAKIALPSQDFIRGIEQAAKHLLESTLYSRALYQSSKLHATVLDLPPFALSTGPCQLILFKSFVNTQGAMAAVNHTFSEPLKCVPLTVYRPLCGFITDQAASIYKASSQITTTPTYLMQQQMYRQQTNYESNRTLYSSGGEDDISIQMDTFKDRLEPNTTNINITTTITATPAAEEQDSPAFTAVSDPFSLPPPPRAKRNRFRLTNAPSNNPTIDILSPLQDGSVKTTTSTRNIQSLQAAPLTVLATRDRFWWINPIVEETIHSI